MKTKNTFYALALNSDGKSLRINFDDMDKLPSNRFEAELIAQAHCKKNGLKYQDVCKVQLAEKGGSTMTKFFEKRKRGEFDTRVFARSL